MRNRFRYFNSSPEVILRPRVTVAAGSDLDKARALHEKAHADCFVANSVNFPVRNEPEIVADGEARS